jgi:acyl-CoA synthetase (AMP-forming)/AMP-acid ligase II
MLAAELVRRGARRHAGRTALVVDGRELSFAEVGARANRLAHALHGLGARPGDRIGLLVDNGEWSVPLDFACVTSGLARVPLNSRLSADEHARMLTGTGVRLLVHGAGLAGRAHELAARVPELRLAGLAHPPDRAGDADLTAEAATAPDTDPGYRPEPGDPTLVLFTSGTTGTLKAAVHTQASYAAITANILANLLSPGPGDAMLHAASLIHASGTFVLPYWLRGGRSVVLPGFAPDTFADAVDRHRVTAVNLVPTMLGLLLDSGELDDRARAGSLTSVVYGASPMPRPLLERGLDRFGPILTQYYGQTEAPLCQAVLDRDDHRDPSLLGAAGQPAVDAEVLVTDPDGHPVPAGEVGEIRVRAPFTMAGYHDAPELTARTLTPDGWVRTRDLARMDERGYLYLVDRTSDMIITGGYNVYPREVEDALAAHPAVAECAVVGAPDPTWVEAVTAFVVPRPGATATPEELRAAVRERLAGYKVPRRIELVDSIPRSPVGKVLRRALRDPLWTDQERSR